MKTTAFVLVSQSKGIFEVYETAEKVVREAKKLEAKGHHDVQAFRQFEAADGRGDDRELIYPEVRK